jgi:putative nucleotidyltransferase with HDIG domain
MLDVTYAIESLPAMPVAVTRLSALLVDDRSSTSQVAAVIRTDPGLTANLLRIANSAAFRGRLPTATVQDAVARLGSRRVHELLSCDWLRRTLPGALPFYGHRPESFWHHCVATAVISERLGESCALKSNALFAAGLLHDIGQIVIALAWGAARRGTPPARGSLSILELERKVVGDDHASIGARLATTWRLPSEVEAAVRYHHALEQAPPAAKPVVAAVRLASAAADRFGLGICTGDDSPIDPAALSVLKLGAHDLDAIGTGCLERIRVLCGLDLGAAK